MITDEVWSVLCVKYLTDIESKAMFSWHVHCSPSIIKLHWNLIRRNKFKKETVFLYNFTQCGETTKYLLGPNSASFVVMQNQCCYMDLRHGNWLKLQPQSCRRSLIAAYIKFWIPTGRKWSQMKNFGEGLRKSRYPYRLKGRNGIG